MTLILETNYIIFTEKNTLIQTRKYATTSI